MIPRQRCHFSDNRQYYSTLVNPILCTNLAAGTTSGQPALFTWRYTGTTTTASSSSSRHYGRNTCLTKEPRQQPPSPYDFNDAPSKRRQKNRFLTSFFLPFFVVPSKHGFRQIFQRATFKKKKQRTQQIYTYPGAFY